MPIAVSVKLTTSSDAVAVAVPELNATVGTEVYPEPAAVTFTAVTSIVVVPPVPEQVPVQVPPLKLKVGAVEYPEPPLVMVTEVTGARVLVQPPVPAVPKTAVPVALPLEKATVGTVPPLATVR